MEEAGEDSQREGVRPTVEIVRALKSIDGIAGVQVMGLGKEEAVRQVIEGSGLLPRPA